MSSSLTLETLLILACVRRDLDAEAHPGSRETRSRLARDPSRGGPLELWRRSCTRACGKRMQPAKCRIQSRSVFATCIAAKRFTGLSSAMCSGRRYGGSPTHAFLPSSSRAQRWQPSSIRLRALRPTRQVDLLVRQSDAARVEALLKSMRDAPVRGRRREQGRGRTCIGAAGVCLCSTYARAS